ncbi:MAG TPA: HTH domain-containing protein, partial [bacterium]|nr:HTH domain-containing protein [bacterium]
DENLASYYDTMAAVLLDKGELRQALKWARQSHAYFSTWNGRFRFLGAHIDFRLGMCYLELAEYQKALTFLRKAITAWEKEEELGLRILALSAIGRLHAAESQFAQAIAYAREVEGLLRRVDGVDLLQNVHWNQYITFRTAGSDAAARRSLRRAYLCLMQQSHNLKGRYRRRFLHGVKTNREIVNEFERMNEGDLDYPGMHNRPAAVFVHPLSVLGMLDDITERRRVVSEYVRLGQLTQREIAFRLGVSERTIRSDVANLRKQEHWGTGSTKDDSGPGRANGS